MSLTPFKQFIFPPSPAAGGHNLGFRINKGMLGYDAPSLTASQRLYLGTEFGPLAVGDFERTRCDIDGDLVVPKIELHLQDVFKFWGTSNSIDVSYDLESSYSSLLNEIFDDDTLVYEVWFDDYLGSTLDEIWFVGDVFLDSIPINHILIRNEGTSTAVRLSDWRLTINFATERFKANKNRAYTIGSYPGNGVTWVPGSIMDFAFSPNTLLEGVNFLLWGTADTNIKHVPIYAGSSTGQVFEGGTIFGSAPEAGIVRGYGYPFNPTSEGDTTSRYFADSCMQGLVPTVSAVPITLLANLIAQYGFGNSGSASFDTRMMFDLWGQLIDNAGTPTKFPMTQVAGQSSGNGWDKIYLYADMLFGKSSVVTNSYGNNGISLTGPTNTTVHPDHPINLTGKIYDWNPGYMEGNMNLVGGAGTFTLWTCDSSFDQGRNYYGNSNTYITGSIDGSSVFGTIVIGPCSAPIVGTYDSGTNTMTLTEGGPLLAQWPSTIGPNENLSKLLLWIAAQTGTWLDTVIDTSGNVTVHFRARRAQDTGSYFGFNYLSLDPSFPAPLVSGSSQDPTEISQTALVAQCQGDSLALRCGASDGDPLKVTIPWRCHKFGAIYSYGGGFYIINNNRTNSGNAVWYYPNNNQNQCVEHWWDRTTNDFTSQWQYVSVDDRTQASSDGNGRGNPFGGQSSKSPSNGNSDQPMCLPTSVGWAGSTLLLYDKPSGTYPFPSGVSFEPDNAEAMMAVAAITPGGLTPPTDEFFGGYFDAPRAAAQFYYMEMIGKKISLTQQYIGCRGDDGKIQSLRPGLLHQFLVPSRSGGSPALVTFEMHNVKQNPFEDTCTIQWLEHLSDSDYLARLPDAYPDGGAGTSTASSSVGSATGGGGSTTGFGVTDVDATLSGTVNDLNIGSTGGIIYLRLTSSADAILTGIVAIRSTTVYIKNVGSHNITLESLTGSAAANQFNMAGPGPNTLPAGGTATLFYDGTLANWIILSVGGGG